MIRLARPAAGSRDGFTLIEVVVAMAVFAIFMIGILNLLDTSTSISEIEKALTDTQENVRFAAYHLTRTVRMTGGAGMPFAGPGGGSGTWVAGELLSNQSGSIASPYSTFGNIDVLDGTDVVTVRGFFEIPPFFVDNNAVNTALNTIEIEQSSPGSGTDKREFNPQIDTIEVSQLEGRGLVFMGELDRSEYAVGEVAASSEIDGTDPDQELTLKINGTPASWWAGLNPGGSYSTPSFEVYQVGVLDSYTYFVDPNFRLMRLRADNSAAGASLQPVAVNIGGLQVALGVDNDLDGQVDVWQAAPTAAGLAASGVIAMRITVFGRTPIQVPGWQEPAATFGVVNDTQTVDTSGRSAKWRRVDVVATLRNFMF